jgi:hypothetical protein
MNIGQSQHAERGKLRWAWEDLNLRPLPYQIISAPSSTSGHAARPHETLLLLTAGDLPTPADLAHDWHATVPTGSRPPMVAAAITSAGSRGPLSAPTQAARHRL